ncbi:hypothetical protein QMT40_001462 [Parvibaculaceae bacterium PLY_AMNH_Bact1]|nr:hypothetical protein QMT40_001462 [Parvibaculaceae bacterium PLY_AMNH_Bact1]
MAIDFTQWWVPAIIMLVLGTGIFIAGLREYRMPAPVAPAPAETEDAGSEPSASAAAKQKSGFLVRTSWIWGSVLVGAAAQAYLSYVAV